MPNDCWNEIVITGDSDDIKKFHEEFRDIPEWALEMKIKKELIVQFRIWSRWIPDFPWLEGLFDKYPSLWVKNIWHEEGGKAGIWVGKKDNVKTLEWDDISIEEQYFKFG